MTGVPINNLRFADDIEVLEGNEDNLEDAVQTLSNEAKCYELMVNIEKTKTMVLGQKDIEERSNWIELS